MGLGEGFLFRMPPNSDWHFAQTKSLIFPSPHVNSLHLTHFAGQRSQSLCFVFELREVTMILTPLLRFEIGVEGAIFCSVGSARLLRGPWIHEKILIAVHYVIYDLAHHI